MWQPRIALRQSFQHAAAARDLAEPLIVSVTLADGTIGYGETHPREYVTGESMEGAIATIRDVFVPLLVDAHPQNFGEAIALASDLPTVGPDGRPITAARAAVELALLDAYSKAFDRSLDALAGWVDERLLGAPGSQNTARFSGVVSADHPDRVARSIRKMRLIRLPHFKVKVGDKDDDDRVEVAIKTLGRGLRDGRITLRIDANSAWSLEQAAAKLQEWECFPITCAEQPLPRDPLENWAELAGRTNIPLMADESLVTYADGEALIAAKAAGWFNIRLSKNGGLIPSMKLATLAARHGIDCQMGCMVGETSILSAASRWFLRLVPGISIAEGSFGRFLLDEDVTRRSLRFGWRGRWRVPLGPGLGVEVLPESIARLSPLGPINIPF